MPYIKKEDRQKLDKELTALANKLSIKCNEGDYNYVITQLIHSFTSAKGLNYKTLNAAVGILECAKAEFIRTVVTPYEEKKIKENGHISYLDGPNNSLSKGDKDALKSDLEFFYMEQLKF